MEYVPKPDQIPTADRTGLTCAIVVPPGKVVAGRKDLFEVGLCEKFWQWNEEQIRSYL